MREAKERHNYVLDPQYAVGYVAAQQLSNSSTPVMYCNRSSSQVSRRGGRGHGDGTYHLEPRCLGWPRAEKSALTADLQAVKTFLAKAISA